MHSNLFIKCFNAVQYFEFNHFEVTLNNYRNLKKNGNALLGYTSYNRAIFTWTRAFPWYSRMPISFCTALA